MRTCILLAGVLAVTTACTDPTGSAETAAATHLPQTSTTAVPDTMLKLMGIGKPAVVSSLNVAFDINAEQLWSGAISSNSMVTLNNVVTLKPAATYPVTNLCAPTAVNPFWGVTYQDPVELVTLYIMDIGDGKTTFDQLSYAFGTSCVATPAPSNAFLTLDSGDFKGQVKLR